MDKTRNEQKAYSMRLRGNGKNSERRSRARRTKTISNKMKK